MVVAPARLFDRLLMGGGRPRSNLSNRLTTAVVLFLCCDYRKHILRRGPVSLEGSSSLASTAMLLSKCKTSLPRFIVIWNLSDAGAASGPPPANASSALAESILCLGFALGIEHDVVQHVWPTHQELFAPFHAYWPHSGFGAVSHLQ